MDVHSKPLEICLYLKNGSESRFAMDDAAAATELLATIQPGHLFSRPELIIGGSYSLTMIRTDSVDCIEFVTAGYPGWPFAPKVKDALQITPAEFQSMISGGPAERLRTADASAEGVQFDACAELVLGSGKRLYHALNMIGDPQTPVDRGLSLSHIFNRGVFVARLPGGGAAIINPAHVIQVTLFPGPAETPPNAWLAHHVPTS
jgi:hypothetical protein